jgi:8-oxo-dGTP pyrophosphatase MutT (NUDIX family)
LSRQYRLAVPEDDRLRNEIADTEDWPPPAMYALSAVVYAERGDEILLLQRAEGSALAGEWFLPGGLVEPGELPEEGARRELAEEAGVAIGELELIGCYPMWVYGYDMLQISYRGTIVDESDVGVSHEHDGARWVKAADMRALLTDDVLEGMARGEERIRSLLGHIRADLDRYLVRVAETSTKM